jgi:quinol-cytochrome oxidoreductase complex cytochrome b subunit
MAAKPKLGDPTWEKSPTTDLLREYSEEAARIEAERRAKKKLKPVEGQPFWPHEVLRDSVILCLFVAGCLFLSALMPYFLETPADPRGPPAVILPDWYLLWSYGLLKITDDITICGGWADKFPDVCGVIVHAPNIGSMDMSWTTLNAKLWGLLLNAVVVLPLVILPFIDRGNSRRPVESPAMASFAFAWTMYIFMISVYSINNVINTEWPIFGKEYLVWTRDYITLFQLDLLALLTNLVPIISFFICYIPLKMVQKKHGYEAKLNANYYKVR